MRSRLLIGAVVALSSIAATAGAQGSDYADGLLAGDYLRLSGGMISPVNPQGSLGDWKRGNAFSLIYENWQPGSGGVGRVAFGIGIDYGLLPLDEQHFIAGFTPATGGKATSV